MKQMIRTAALLVLTAAVTLQFSAAQTTEKRFDTDAKIVARVSKNLMLGLRSGNAGLMESCMRMTAQMKMRYPWCDVTPLTAVIGDILSTNTSGTTRYKAYVALAVCEAPATFAADTAVARGNELDFFRAAAHRMQEHLLSSAE